MQFNIPSISDIGQLRHESVDAIRTFYSLENLSPPDRLQFMTSQELEDQFQWAKAELDFHLMLGILAALEAHFRRDFEIRCKNRLKDALLREFRNLKKKRKDRVQLDEDILGAWKNHHPVHNRLVSDIRSVLNLRHWLAHGRHWLPKFGQNYDFTDVELLTYSVLSNFDFQ